MDASGRRLSRTLRWIAAACLVLTPVVAWLGRPRPTGCEPPVTMPCDPVKEAQAWMPVTLFLLVAVAFALLIAATIARVGDDD